MGCFHFGAVTNTAIMIFLLDICFHFSWALSWMEFLGHKETSCSQFEELTNCFLKQRPLTFLAPRTSFMEENATNGSGSNASDGEWCGAADEASLACLPAAHLQLYQSTVRRLRAPVLEWLHHFTFPPAIFEDSTPLLTLVYPFFYYALPSGYLIWFCAFICFYFKLLISYWGIAG